MIYADILEGKDSALDVGGSAELRSVAALLGVASETLYLSLTTRSVYSHKQYNRSTNTALHVSC